MQVEDPEWEFLKGHLMGIAHQYHVTLKTMYEGDLLKLI
jgi:hypothetical protein